MKDGLIVGALCLLAIAGGTWIFFSGSPFARTSGISASLGPVGFSVLAKGVYAPEISSPVNYRLKNMDEFTALWILLERTDPMPAVNFETEEVLAVFDEERSTGGYAISVASITDMSEERRVAIQHEVPGETCVVGQALTKPYVLVVVSKTPLSITHTRETVTIECE